MTDASAAPARRRFLVLENPMAGIARRTLTDSVVHELQARGCAVMRLAAGSDPAGVDWDAAARGHDAVIAAGGDGTVRALAGHLSGRGLPIGLIPRGTGNVLSAEIGLPRTAGAIADVLIGGPVVRLKGARANGRPFFLMAGVGFDGETVHRLDLALKRRVGRWAYIAPVLAALAQPEPRLEVRIDGGAPREAGWVLIANAQRYGGRFRLSHRAGLAHDGLIVFLFSRGGRARRVADLMALATGTLDRMPGVAVEQAARVSVASPDPAAAQIDGDDFGTVPLDIEWGEPELALIVPEAYAATLAAGAQPEA